MKLLRSSPSSERILPRADSPSKGVACGRREQHELEGTDRRRAPTCLRRRRRRLDPRLLTAPAIPPVTALGPGPGRSVVQPAAPRPPSHAARPSETPSILAPAAAPVASTRPVTPAPAPIRVRAKPAPAPTPATREPSSPTPLPTRSQGSGPQPAALGHEPLPLPSVPPPYGPPDTQPHGLPGEPPHERAPSPLVKPGWRRGADDLEGSEHGRPFSEAPPVGVGAHPRGVGHLPSPSPPATPAARQARPQAWPDARRPRGKGGVGPPPQVAPGDGHGPDCGASGRHH